jgi:hypothetical protein
MERRNGKEGQVTANIKTTSNDSDDIWDDDNSQSTPLNLSTISPPDDSATKGWMTYYG